MGFNNYEKQLLIYSINTDIAFRVSRNIGTEGIGELQNLKKKIQRELELGDFQYGEGND